MKAVAGNFTNVYFRIFLLLLWFPLVAQAGDIDFSNYDVPLYTQIVDRIKAKIALRLGDGPLTHERYFIIPFAYQDRGNHPEFSHSFISVIRVFADNKAAKLTPGLPTRQYKNWEFETFTISWLPRDFLSNPHLCVFDGAGSRIFPEKNKCPVSTGRNFTLAETIKLAVDAKNAVAMWGPHEIEKAAFDLAVKRKRLLDGGTIRISRRRPSLSKRQSRYQLLSCHAGFGRAFPKGGISWDGTQDVGLQWNGQSADRIHREGE